MNTTQKINMPNTNDPLSGGALLLDSAIDRCLERQAEPQIPANFAAQVVAALPPARASRRVPALRRNVAIAAAALLLCAIFMLAPHTSATFANSAFDLQLLLLAQLAGIGVWLAIGKGVSAR